MVDEASLGLAPIVVDAIFEFFERVAREGTALLLVDQYVTRALHIAHTVYVLRKGEVVYHGPSAGLSEERVVTLYDTRSARSSPEP